MLLILKWPRKTKFSTNVNEVHVNEGFIYLVHVISHLQTLYKSENYSVNYFLKIRMKGRKILNG